MIEARSLIVNTLSRCLATAALLLRDRRGVAAIEFAFIAPILLCMYFLTMEVSQAIETNKKLGRAGSMVGDLITQQDSIQQSEVDAIMQIGDSLLQPYTRSKPVITVTAIDIGTDATTGKAKGTVKWSRRMEDGKFSKGEGADATVPASLLVSGTFLIKVDAALAYKPVILYSAGQKAAFGIQAAFDGISMGETYYLRPRMSTSISCTGC